MVNTSFVNRGSDDALVKSLQEHGLVPEELSKAIDKSKLVQVEIQVQGKNGTFTRKQWKKAGDVKSTDKVVGGQAVGRNTKTTMTKQEFDKKYPNGNYQNPEDVYRRNGKNATWKGQPLSNPSVMKQAKADYQQFLKDKAALDANTKTQKASNTASSSGPVDISKFKFTNYRNPDGQNYTGRETFRGTLESIAKETERKAQNVVNSYSGAMTPEKQLRIAFDNINRHSTYRDLVDSFSEQGLKDAKKAISDRQRELIESVKDLTKWDGNKWVKDDSSKSDKPTISDIVSYGYDPATSTGDPTILKIGNQSFYKIGDNKWKSNYSNSHNLGGIYTDMQISEKVYKTSEKVEVNASKKNSWQTKIDKGSFTDAEKKALSYGIYEKHSCLLGKDGNYKTAKTWDEADYAVKHGWTNFGSITKIISDGKLKESNDISKDFKTFESITGRESSSVPNGTQILYGRSANKDGNHSSEFVNADNVKKGHVKVVEHLKSQGFTVVSEHSYTPKSSYLQTTPISTGMELTITHLKDDKGSDLYVKSRVGGWSEKQFVSIITKEQGVNTNTVWDEKSGSSTSFEIPKTKDAIQKLVSSGVSKKDIMEQAKAYGVTWKHNDHEGINWMRCCMAMTGTTTKGGKKS